MRRRPSNIISCVVLAGLLAACGGSSGSSGESQSDVAAEPDAGSETASTAASTEQSDEDSPDSEREAESPQDAEAPAPEPPEAGVSQAVFTLDGTEYVFTEFAQCLVFSERFMSAIAFSDSGDLDVSYEEPNVEEDGEGSEYANTIEFESPDGNQSWRAGTVVGGYSESNGTLDWSKDGNTITGTATFENIYDPESAAVPGSLSLTCA